MDTANTTKQPRNRTGPLKSRFREDDGGFEIGVDEAGRGPLFGRLYVAAAILPKCEFRHEWMKDSKRFSSQKKIREVAEYIKQNAVAWTVKYAESDTIDEINIRQAVLKTMRECCRDLIERTKCASEKFCLLVDGNDFPAYTHFDQETETLVEIESHTIEGGDNQYTCIAAASILAKVARDDWIAELCEAHPFLKEWYGIDRNKGYGTAEHMRGIQEHGITVWHRRSYGPCKTADVVDSPDSQINNLYK
jgi:ribonuclease HII